MYHPETLAPIVAFLNGIGIQVEFGDGGLGGFLPGVNIHGGVFHVHSESLEAPGDLLHEAGHIVVLPRRYWSRMNGDMQVDMEAIMAEQTARDGAFDPLLDKSVRFGEFMAQAWSYAAVRFLGLPQGCLFFPGSYKHHEYEGIHPMQEWIENGTHYGPNHLAKSGLTGFSGLFASMGNNGLAPFPEMARWTYD